MSIRAKFISLLIIIFIVVFSGVSFLIFYNLQINIEQQIRARLDVTAGLLAMGGFPVNPESLGRLSDIVGSEVLVFDLPIGATAIEEITDSLGHASSLTAEKEKAVLDVFEAHPDAWQSSGEINRQAFAGLGFYAIGTLKGQAQPKLVFLLLDKTELDALYRNTGRPLVIIGAVSILLLGLLAVGIARAMTGPLQKLNAHAKRIAAGDLNVQVEIARRDEIGELAQTFNTMCTGLRQAQEQLIHAEKMSALGQLATGIAHEIRNPLASLKMAVELLLSRAEEVRTREGLSNMLEDVQRLQLYVEELLEYSRPGEVCPAMNSLNRVVGEVLAFTDKQFKHQNIVVKSDLAQDLPGTLFDSSKVKQVVMNLILNAAQATGHGKFIRVHTEEIDHSLRFSVQDAGPGVAEEIASRIFTPFFTTKEGGTGLGLSVCQSIIHDHGGRLNFENNDRGALFWFELPIKTN